MVETGVSIGVANYVDEFYIDRQRVADFLARHEIGAWGDLSDEQKLKKNLAVKCKKDFVSFYNLEGQLIIIVTYFENGMPKTMICTAEEFAEDLASQ